jgi:hypothetical protein
MGNLNLAYAFAQCGGDHFSVDFVRLVNCGVVKRLPAPPES